jgi:PKD repeat protein
VIDLTERVFIGPRDVATALVDASDEGKSLSEVPILGTYATTLGGTALETTLKLEKLLTFAGELEECGIGTSRAQKIGGLTGFLENFTEFGCSGQIGLPQVVVRSTVAANGRTLVADGKDTFIDVTVDPIAFVDTTYPLGININVCDQFPDLPASVKKGCPSLSYTVVTAPIRTKVTQRAHFEFTPTPRVKLELPEPVQFEISPCVTDPRIGTFACSGFSDVIVYDLGSNLVLTVPSGSFHTAAIKPTFLLPGLLDNDINIEASVRGSVKAGNYSSTIPRFKLIDPIVLIPEICVEDGCTPELKFPGLTLPGDAAFLGLQNEMTKAFGVSSDGYLFSKSLGKVEVDDSTAPIFDSGNQKWVLGGFNAVTGQPFVLDAEVKPTVKLDGPSVMNEGDQGVWDTARSVEIDFDEFLTFSYKYGDGIIDFSFGDPVTHAYADDGTFTVTAEGDDTHEETDTASRQVQVNNVSPSLTVGGRDTEEGSPVDLSPPPFNRQLLVNGGAEQGVAGWTVNGGVTAQPYAARGSSLPVRAAKLVTNATPGYYANLDGALNGFDIFPVFSTLVPLQSTLRLYPESHYLGNKNILFTSGAGAGSMSVPCLDAYGWDNDAASFKATNFSLIQFYDGCNFTSNFKNFVPGDPLLLFDAEDNRLSSFEVTSQVISVPSSPPYAPNSQISNWGPAEGLLGNWRGRFRPTGGNWSGGITGVDSLYAGGTANAIVYEIDAGEGGITGVSGNFAATHGIWVYLNGVQKFGAVEPGAGVALFEHVEVPLGDLPPGKNYIQVIRYAHFSANGESNILITGTTRGGRPAVDTPGSFFRGNSYFFGGANSSGGSASQTINAAPNDGAARFIDRGEVVYQLAGFVGGIALSNDSARVTVIMKDGNGQVLAQDEIGPVQPGQRGGVTRLKHRIATGVVPPLTRTVEVVVNMARQDGADADGYVDDLTLRLLAALGAFVQDPGVGDTHKGTTDWGDGTFEIPQVDQEPGFALFLLNHIYRDNKPDNADFTVNVTAQDDDYPALVNGLVTGRDTGSFQVPVRNVPPEVTAFPNVFSLNDPALDVLVATFEDPGVLDGPWTATIDWGDGTVTPGTVSNNRVTGSHNYTTAEADLVTQRFASVTVRDKDGGLGTGYMTNLVAVTTVPGVHASEDRNITEGGAIIELSGGFIALTPGLAGVPKNIAYEYTWDFGDGTSLGPVRVTQEMVTQDEAANLILDALRTEGPMTRTELLNRFFDPDFGDGGDGEDPRLQRALNLLLDRDFVKRGQEPGRRDQEPVEVWTATDQLVEGLGVPGGHTYADDGVFVVTFTVLGFSAFTGESIAVGADQFTVTAANSAPTVGATSNVTVGEDAKLTRAISFSDAGIEDTHSATFNWGDGTRPSVGLVNEANGTATASHTYEGNGFYTVTVTVRDDDGGGCGEDTQTMLVANVPVEIVALELRSASPVHIEGLPLNLTADINDKGTRDSHTATIDWGDGTPIMPGLVSEIPSGPPGRNAGADGTVTGTHRYADNGQYDVTVCVNDDDSTTCAVEQIKVTNAAPVVEAGSDIVANEGAFIALSPAAFTDSGFDSSTIPSKEDFGATIDWGDGTTEPVEDITLVETPGNSGSLTTGRVQASHAYGRYGIYTVIVCVADDDQDPEAAIAVDGRGCDTLTATVNEVAPVVDAGPDRRWFENTRFTLNPTTFTDAGYDSEFTAVVDWGDGVVEPASTTMVVATHAGEGELETGFVQAQHNYSDDGVYRIEVCVNDGRLITCDTTDLTIVNVNPVINEPSFLATQITFPSRDAAFLGQKLVAQTHASAGSDIGSDDISYNWSFIGNPDRFGGRLPPAPPTELTTTYNDGLPAAPAPFTDPAPPDTAGAPTHPHGTFPFQSGDSTKVTFNAPGVYVIDLLIADDNGGTDRIALSKLVVDTSQTTKIVPLWKQFYSDRGRVWATDATLLAYLDIVNFASGVFDGMTKADAQALLTPGGNDAQRKARQEALAAWLNFANGSIPWGAVVPSGQRFQDAIAGIEAVLLSPNSTKADYDAAARLGFRMNLMAVGNPACGPTAGGKK